MRASRPRFAPSLDHGVHPERVCVEAPQVTPKTLGNHQQVSAVQRLQRNMEIAAFHKGLRDVDYAERLECRVVFFLGTHQLFPPGGFFPSIMPGTTLRCRNGNVNFRISRFPQRVPVVGEALL